MYIFWIKTNKGWAEEQICEKQDWLYCLVVGERPVTDEWDGQEMFAFLMCFYHGALVGKAKHYV